MMLSALARARKLLSDYGNVAAFALVHLGCLLALKTGAPPDALAAFFAVYVVHAIGITAGYHRYFSHRSFKTSRAFQFVLALMGTLAAQKGVLWWTAYHRLHHRTSDTPHDPHSPHYGFWRAHAGWFLAPGSEATDWRRVRDWKRFPELVWLNEHFLLPPLALALGLYLAGGLPWFAWGFCICTTMTWHITYTVNSVAHRHGYRNFQTSDDSRNVAWLALPTWGDAWHNNHHHHPRAARHGLRWWEIDLTYGFLRTLARLGVVWDLVPVPAGALARVHAPSHEPRPAEAAG